MNRCDELVRKGTGYGACNRRLDEYDQCDRAADHLSSADLAAIAQGQR